MCPQAATLLGTGLQMRLGRPHRAAGAGGLLLSHLSVVLGSGHSAQGSGGSIPSPARPRSARLGSPCDGGTPVHAPPGQRGSPQLLAVHGPVGCPCALPDPGPWGHRHDTSHDGLCGGASVLCALARGGCAAIHVPEPRGASSVRCVSKVLAVSPSGCLQEGPVPASCQVCVVGVLPLPGVSTPFLLVLLAERWLRCDGGGRIYQSLPALLRLSLSCSRTPSSLTVTETRPCTLRASHVFVCMSGLRHSAAVCPSGFSGAVERKPSSLPCVDVQLSQHLSPRPPAAARPPPSPLMLV